MWRLYHATKDGRLFNYLVLPVVEGGTTFPDEAGYDRINGGARAEEHASDLGGRASVGGEKGDVHPEPAAGLCFSLHLDDEALA